MSLEPEQDRFFRIGTFVVLGLTFVFCLCYTILFVNPQIPLNPLKVQPTRAAAATLAPTWTPTATRTPTLTGTPEPTQPPTDTPPPTATASATRVPPSPTRFIFSTPRPAATRPPVGGLTPVPTVSPYTYNFVGQKCEDSGGVYIEIYVFTSYPSSPLGGARVRASYAPDGPALGDTDVTTNSDGKGQYTLQTGLPARPGTYYAWVVDTTGKRISPVSGAVNINTLKPDDPASCKLAKIAFSK